MILINGHWETVNDLHDVSKVIREYYNPELADRLDELVEEVHVSEKHTRELEDLIEEIRILVG